MFEEPLNIILEREDVIAHDRGILEKLKNGDQPVHYVWRMLCNMRSDTVRYYAMKEFLESYCKATRVNEITTGRVHFIADGNQISLPAIDAEDEEIHVHLPYLTDPVSQLRSPTLCPPGNQEKFVAEYLELLKGKANYAQRTKLRFPSFTNRSDLFCTIFYCCILVPKDYLCGRSSISFWEQSYQTLQSRRIAQEEALLLQWQQFRKNMRNFYFSNYPIFEAFHMPVLVGCKGHRIHIEEAMSLCEDLPLSIS